MNPVKFRVWDLMDSRLGREYRQRTEPAQDK
jgi:hypothetical protein